MKKKIGNRNRRIPLENNKIITLNDVNIVCKSYVGGGSTCLVYRGYVSSGSAIIPNTEVIIKEFYPVLKSDEYGIFRDETTGKLSIYTETFENSIENNSFLRKIADNPIGAEREIHDRTNVKSELEHKFIQFSQGIVNQKRLSRSDAMEIAIKPWIEGWWGESYYVISDIHRGTDLSRVKLDTLEKRFLVAIGIAESMDILHETGFLLLDMKPENMMWIEHPSMIRIIDVDSLVRFDEIGNVDRVLLSNFRYASPEIEVLSWKMDEGLSEDTLRKVRKEYLQKDSNFYSMGIYLWELFFEETYSEFLLQNKDKNLLLSLFVEKYAARESYDRNKLLKVGSCLIEILERMIIENRTKRRKEGYNSADVIMKALNEIYTMLTSKKYLFRKEVAKANGTFAAYNLLQKYPLFQYNTLQNKILQNKTHPYGTYHSSAYQTGIIQYGSLQSGIKEKVQRLEVVLIGNHAMRSDMLSAVISIGQMLDTQLHIYLISPDVEKFWSDYLSDEQNPALKDGVVWSLNERMISDTINPFLVARPLAHIHLLTKETVKALHTLNTMKVGRYFIVLEEDITKKNEICQLLYDTLREESKNEKYLISYLQTQEESICMGENSWIEKQRCNVDFVPISSDSFSESYNEKMFEKQIYNMGLMAYAYYNGFMADDADVDMDVLERDFRKDLYGIASSERCALHSLYKIASLGIARNKPGRYLNFYRKLQEPEILEKLAWLEHLSWTAYLLTSGAVPVFFNENDITKEYFEQLFESYAYIENNDWKDKRVSAHVRHPFLVAYYLDGYRKMKKGWLDGEVDFTEEEIEMLDPLDKVSYRLSEWYRDKVKKLRNENGENHILQETDGVKTRVSLDIQQNYARITSDAQKERDIKQSDRDLVFAAVDMII